MASERALVSWRRRVSRGPGEAPVSREEDDAQRLNPPKDASDFGRDVLKVLGGATYAQTLPLIVSPLLSRLYTPADFALWALCAGIAALLSPITTGAYEQAIPLAKEDQDAIAIAACALLLAAALSAVLIPGIWIAQDLVTSLLKNLGLRAWLATIPALAAVMGSCQALNYWLVRKRRYPQIARGRIVCATCTAALSVLCGMASLGGNGLILSTMVGQLMCAAYLLGASRGKALTCGSIRLGRVFFVARQYRRFPVFILPQTLCDSVRDNGLLMLMSSYYGAAVVGQYSLAVRVIKTPASLIGSAVSQVFYERSCADHTPGRRVWPGARMIMLRLGVAAGCGTLLMLTIGPRLFQLLFGAAWRTGGEFGQALIVGVMANFVVSPVTTLFLVFRQQALSLKLSVAYDFSILLVFYLAARSTDGAVVPLLAVSAVTLAYAVAVGVLIRGIADQKVEPA